jgi:hypothetical protein
MLKHFVGQENGSSEKCMRCGSPFYEHSIMYVFVRGEGEVKWVTLKSSETDSTVPIKVLFKKLSKWMKTKKKLVSSVSLIFAEFDN